MSRRRPAARLGAGIPNHGDMSATEWTAYAADRCRNLADTRSDLALALAWFLVSCSAAHYVTACADAVGIPRRRWSRAHARIDAAADTLAVHIAVATTLDHTPTPSTPYRSPA